MQHHPSEQHPLTLIERVAMECQGPSVIHFRSRSQKEELALIQAMALKRALDTALICVSAPLWLPILACVASVIKLQRRRVFTTQARTGLDGTLFRMIIFCNANSTHHTPSLMDRITQSAWLRYLPQLVNVVKGEMALVGPRSHSLYHDRVFAKLAFGYTERFRMRPGLTGMAQLHYGRAQMETQEEIQRYTTADNAYINRWSLGKDLAILLRSMALRVATRKPA
ncbi:MAG: hypothetical protein CMM93_09210 [Rickettsiales bacterium]|nr:hypothetical protein [Rickettsiales bacterium]